jgi:tetratricopeptide (TPR) repeat protein
VAALLEKLQEALAGRYEVERELGRGGSATVFLARDLKHPREVAIKVLDPEVARVVGRERFLREIEITASLTHPHILPVFDSGSIDDCLFYVMPYVKGESLRSRLERQGRLPVDEALQVAREVADALAYAHRNEVLHRDIKPANILLEEGHAVVADFGIARAIHAAGAATLTETGMIVGTPAYMSPEQVSGRGTLDGRSDLYSLGCVLYEMLAGAPPFRADTPLAYAHQHVEATPRALAELCPDVPHGVSQVLARVLAKRPEERFATADEFAQALASPGALAPRAPWQRRRVAIAAAAAVAVLAAVTTWWALHPLRPKSPPAPAKPEWVLLADFDGPADAPELAGAVRELVRTDIDQSPFVHAVPKDQVQMALALAEKPETTRVTEALARELAYRNEIPTVLSGTIVRVGREFAGRLTEELLASLGARRGVIAAKLSPLQGVTASFEAFKEYRRGLDLNGQGRDREAIREYRAALALDPDFALAWLELSASYANVGEWDSSLFACAEAKRRANRLVGASRLILDAATAWARADLPGCVEAYDRVLEVYPNDVIALNNRALALRDMGFYEASVAGFRQATEAFPVAPAPLIYWSLMITQANLSQLEEAQRVADQLPDLLRKEASLMLAVHGDRWARAESLAAAAFRSPLPDAGLQSFAAMARAGVYARRGQLRDATASLRRVESLASGGPLFAWIHWAQRLRLALDATVSNPDSAPLRPSISDRGIGSLVTLGMAEASAGRLGTAEELLGQIQRRPPNERRRFGEAPALLRAWIARGRGQWPQVVEALAALCVRADAAIGEVVPTDGPGRPLCRWLVAEAYQHLGQPDSAAAYYESALSPERLYFEEHVQRAVLSSFAHQRLVVLYAGMGRHEKAREHWRLLSATCTRPDPPVRQQLAEAQRAVTGS